jgi:4-carboxymuconolactone decarboxylase
MTEREEERWQRGLKVVDEVYGPDISATMLGRADLIEVQVGGAIRNGELTDEQLDEILLLMLVYAGAGNTGALMKGIDAAKKAAKQAAEA